MSDKIILGNFDAKRDWGHAKDYVEAMWLVLQHNIPDDFVIATGKTTSIRNFLINAFEYAGISIKFEGSGVNEKAIVMEIRNSKWEVKKDQVVVVIDAMYHRPTEVDLLIGDATKAKEKLGWAPKYSLEQMIQEMVEADIKYCKDNFHFLKP